MKSNRVEFGMVLSRSNTSYRGEDADWEEDVRVTGYLQPAEADTDAPRAWEFNAVNAAGRAVELTDDETETAEILAEEYHAYHHGAAR